MKRFSFLLLLAFSPTAYAANDSDCVFDESAYLNFINSYNTERGKAKIEPDGTTLSVIRGREEIIVKGGGCSHLGVTISLLTDLIYTEEQFLQKVLDLASEFGGWLINITALSQAVAQGNYQILDGVYHIHVDAMTVFSASYSKQGVIAVEFYIN